MENKGIKIHQLRGKAKKFESSLGTLPAKHSIEVKQGCTNIPHNMVKPILIRYIDPRLVPIFKQFNQITKNHDNIHTKHDKESQHESFTTPIDFMADSVTQRTTKIHKKEARPQENNKISEEIRQDGVISQSKGVIEEINCLQNVCDQQTQKVNRNKQIKEENEELKAQLSKEKMKGEKLYNQNRQLKQKIKIMESQKKCIIGCIKTELVKLKDKSIRC